MRFLTTFGMTGSYMDEEDVGGGEAATNILLSKITLNSLSFRPKGDHEVAAKLNPKSFTGQ